MIWYKIVYNLTILVFNFCQNSINPAALIVAPNPGWNFEELKLFPDDNNQIVPI